MGRRSRPVAFTLVELLVVISVIAVLIAIMLPAYSRAREQGRTAQCLSNMRQTGTGLVMYMGDANDEVPWVNPHPDAVWTSQFAWGGFVAPLPEPTFGNDIDYVKHPAEARPLNKYLAAGAQGNQQIPLYICPSDATRGFVLADDETPPEAEQVTSWQSAGNSYAINWWWMNYYENSGEWSLEEMKDNSATVIKPRLGGRGSAFAVIYEALLNPLFVDARGGGVQGRGWHKQWSRHSLLFLDGHAEHRFVDSRYPFGDGWSIWPAPN